LPYKIGKGYGKVWRSKCRYIAIKGSRRSKKSKTVAQDIIYKIVKYPLSHAIVARRFQNTLKDSCFTEIKWAIGNLGLTDYFSWKESPIEMTYKPTWQKIYFRGLADAQKVTSITT
jgi:phage terminase large subunit